MINLMVTCLCALTALLCAILSLRAYLQSKYKLLLWSGFCFAGLTLSNLVMVVDVYILPDLNLGIARLIIGLSAMLILIYGLIFNEQELLFMTNMLIGAIAMASLVISLFFLNYWTKTGDRFFLLFSLSFFIQCLNRVLMVQLPGISETSALFYSIRLVSYLVILFAVLDKNRGSNPQINVRFGPFDVVIFGPQRTYG